MDGCRSTCFSGIAACFLLWKNSDLHPAQVAAIITAHLTGIAVSATMFLGIFPIVLRNVHFPLSTGHFDKRHSDLLFRYRFSLLTAI